MLYLKGTLSTFLILKQNFVVELCWKDNQADYFYNFFRKNIVFWANAEAEVTPNLILGKAVLQGYHWELQLLPDKHCIETIQVNSGKMHCRLPLLLYHHNQDEVLRKLYIWLLKLIVVKGFVIFVKVLWFC